MNLFKLIKTKTFSFLLIAFFISNIASAQKDLSTGSVLITRENSFLDQWKFRKGDNPAWAGQTFDDTDWVKFDASRDIKQADLHGINWLRVYFRIDSSLIDTTLALVCRQAVASEIYLDGKLLVTYGQLKPTVESYDPQSEPLALTIHDGAMHVLAVRFAKDNNIPGIRGPGQVMPIHNLWIVRYQHIIAEQKAFRANIKSEGIMFLLLSGIFFILTITHFAIFCWHTSQKVHLLYALTTMIGSWVFFFNYLDLNGIHSPAFYQWGETIGMALQSITLCLLTFTIYAVFNYTNKIVSWIIIIVTLFSVVVFLIKDQYGFYLAFILLPVINLAETIRVGIWARKRRLPGAVYVLVGICIFFAFLTSRFIIAEKYADVILTLASLSFPIGMSIFLAIQTAITNRTLEQKLGEVHELSKKNLEQEKEKQHLLADQNTRLEQQVTERTAALQNSLENLKQTQNQLIQSEKMASLGELTAGIAHEIQNPLNFVNNFSEVSNELIDEMNEELEKGDLEEAKAISADLKQNMQKINHHGKRADAIVKGMLQHSRASSNLKEQTDINKLADEYLRLAYHGLRAKDQSFNADLVTNFNPALPKANVIPQDVGRVLLNLFTNAFYATQQHQKIVGGDYKPTLTITTSQQGNNIEIVVKDNGTGIPDAIKDKILQPFFTTKPTGEGTGLGLSLSYDIIVKAHGGSININSKEGNGSEFIINLPL